MTIALGIIGVGNIFPAYLSPSSAAACSASSAWPTRCLRQRKNAPKNSACRS